MTCLVTKVVSRLS